MIMEYYIHFRSRDGLRQEMQVVDKESAKDRIFKTLRPKALNGLKTSKDLLEGFDQVDQREYRKVKERMVIIYEYEEV